jgi:membrane-bound ClpP family serine protease
VSQAVQIFGAVLILTAFALAQFRVLLPSSFAYLLLNLVGAGALAADAFHERQWGFFVLNGVWTLVSAVSLALRRRRVFAPDV